MRIFPPLFLTLGLLLAAVGCRSPLAELKAPPGQRFALWVPPVGLEDHSRALKRLRALQPGEANTSEARKVALEAHGRYLDSAFRQRAEGAGLALDPAAPLRLELTLTTVGEVRTKYIVYGILSGVAWGVGTGLVTHNVKLAIGLGGYELVEESIFWIAGSSLFGRYSAPVVMEAKLFERAKPKPLWHETYFVIWGGKHLKDHPVPDRKDRGVQIHASLDRALDGLFKDLAKIGSKP